MRNGTEAKEKKEKLKVKRKQGGFPLGRQMKGWLRMTAVSDSQPVNDGQSDGGGERAPNPQRRLTRKTPSPGNFTTFPVLPIS